MATTYVQMEKGDKFANAVGKKQYVSPCKQNTQCQARVKRNLHPFSDQNISKLMQTIRDCTSSCTLYKRITPPPFPHPEF